MVSSTTKSKPGIFYGWWMVLGISLTMIYTGGTFFYGFSAFFNPILEEFGWSRATLALAFSLYRLEAGLEAPLVGYLVDRIGPRLLMVTGAIGMGSAFILMSQVQDLWSFYATFVLAAMSLGIGWGPTPGTALAQWFRKKRSRAMGFMFAGYGLSGTLVPGLVWLIDQFGWRQSLIFLGIGVWVVCLPLTLLVRRRPEDYGLLPDGAATIEEEDVEPVQVTHGGEDVRFGEVDFTVGQTLRTRAFWLLVAAVSMSTITIASMNVHMIPYLVSVGISRELAGLAITGLTLTSLLGRLGFGWLGDLFDKRHMFVLAFSLQLVGVLIFANVVEVWMIIPFLLTFAPGYGGPVPLRFAIQGEYFGRQSFGTIMGLTQFMMMWPGIVGPVYAGWIFDITGSYRIAIYTFAPITALAIPLILLARRPRLKEAPVLATGGYTKEAGAD